MEFQCKKIYRTKIYRMIKAIPTLYNRAVSVRKLLMQQYQSLTVAIQSEY